MPVCLNLRFENKIKHVSIQIKMGDLIYKNLKKKQ